jgi:uncharacterized membrane-anchored protein
MNVRSLLVASSLVLAAPALAQEPDESQAAILQALEALPWVAGPDTGDLGKAEVSFDESLAFLGSRGTRELLEMMGNPTSGAEVGLVGPPDLTWFAVFEFDPAGYVKDDEKEELDANALLEGMREGTELANAERERHGWATLEIVGWIHPPHYDSATHNLEWATKARASDGTLSANYNTRLLGRSGVMSVTLVAAPEDLDASMPAYRALLEGFSYKSGERYAEYRSGDKVAEYGLAGLVAGGAGVAALKSGLLSKLWKVVAPAVVAVGAFFRKLFTRSPRPSDATLPPANPSAPGGDVPA